jgi:hypothetical protein
VQAVVLVAERVRAFVLAYESGIAIRGRAT